MRTDCQHYESRTYPSGDTVRKCQLDLAPEAPWRCPDDCPRYERRMMDAGWQYGSFGPQAREEPEPAGQGIAELLDEAEQIVNAAAPDALAEAERRRGRERRGWRRFGRRRR